MTGADGTLAGRVRASPARTRSTKRSSSSRWRSIAGTAASARRRSSRGRRSCCSCCASMRARGAGVAQQAPLLMVDRDAARDGARRHARSHRRRLPSLFGRRRMARAAFREDAVRPGAAGAGVPRSGAGDRRRVLRRRRRGHARLRAARHDAIRRAASIRPRTPTASRRSRRSRRRAQVGGRVLHLDRRRDRRAARRRRRHRPPAVRHRAGRQRAAGSAGRVHRQEPALHRRSRSRRSRQATGRTRGRRRCAALGRIATALFDARAHAAAAAPRRQGPDRLERADDRRVRARRARAAPAAVRRRRTSTPPRAPPRFIRDAPLERVGPARCCGATATATRRSTATPRTTRASIWGLLELFQADGDPRGSTWARELQAQQDERFWDEQDGGWFSTTGRDPSVLLRLKEDYDGAEPSASSVSVLNLLTLAHLGRRGESAARRPSGRSARYGPRTAPPARVDPDDARRRCRPGTPSDTDRHRRLRGGRHAARCCRQSHDTTCRSRSMVPVSPAGRAAVARGARCRSSAR